MKFDVRRGEEFPQSKLTEESVRSIRERHASGESLKDLARQYGVSRTTIGFVVRRQSWRHVK